MKFADCEHDESVWLCQSCLREWISRLHDAISAGMTVEEAKSFFESEIKKSAKKCAYCRNLQYKNEQHDDSCPVLVGYDTSRES